MMIIHPTETTIHCNSLLMDDKNDPEWVQKGREKTEAEKSEAQNRSLFAFRWKNNFRRDSHQAIFAIAYTSKKK